MGGGFIAAKQPLVDTYLMQARQRLFSIALTIPDTAALIEAVKMLDESEHLVQKLWGNVEYLRSGFTELGFDIGHSVQSSLRRAYLHLPSATPWSQKALPVSVSFA